MAEGGANYRDLVPYIGQDPAQPEVQAIIARWHQHLHYFYKPNRQVLQGLGQAYSQDPDFRALFTRIDANLPDFLSRAIEVYCAGLGRGRRLRATLRTGVARSVVPRHMFMVGGRTSLSLGLVSAISSVSAASPVSLTHRPASKLLEQAGCGARMHRNSSEGDTLVPVAKRWSLTTK